jgi:uncharacterized membrane protein
MAEKNLKKQTKTSDAERRLARKQKAAQILFALFAVILILSLVLSAVSTY